MRLASQKNAAIAEAMAKKGVNPADIVETVDLMALEDDLDTHLGAYLQVLEYADGSGPLWSGDRDDIVIRRASAEETEIWKRAVQEADEDPTEHEWGLWLVDVIDPTDEPGSD